MLVQDVIFEWKTWKKRVFFNITWPRFGGFEIRDIAHGGIKSGRLSGKWKTNRTMVEAQLSRWVQFPIQMMLQVLTTLKMDTVPAVFLVLSRYACSARIKLLFPLSKYIYKARSLRK